MTSTIQSNLVDLLIELPFSQGSYFAAVEEFIRMIGDAKLTLKKKKQQIHSFLLRHEYQYDGKTKWIQSLQLKGKLQRTLDEYMAKYEHLTDKIERYAEELEEIFKSERYNEGVSKILIYKKMNKADF